MKNNRMVTVGIPTLGREEVLLDTIKFALDQDYSPFEVVVADQTIGHKSEFLRAVMDLLKKEPRLRYYRVAPPSLPAARNFILTKAKGELLIFIDDDVALNKDFISTHARQHQSHPEANVIAGRIRQKGLPISEFPLYFDKYGLPQGTFNCPDSGPAKMLPGGNHSAPTEILKKVGGYHTAYKYDAVREESDMGYRLQKAGYRIFYSAEAGLTHLSVGHGGSRIYKEQFDNVRFYINDLLFVFRTVGLRYLPMSLFKRLRIYSGGTSLISLRRFKRACLFFIGLIAALWCYIFERHDFKAREVKADL